MSRHKVPITLTYHESGTKPPIYVAGTFSDPMWKPQEMDVYVNQNGDYLFTKEVIVDADSEIQYKFRIGQGDWWALDEDGDKVTDEWGNVNNILRVSSIKSQEDETEPPDINDIAAKSDIDGSDIGNDEVCDGIVCPVFSHECVNRPCHEERPPDRSVDQPMTKTLPPPEKSHKEPELDLDDPRLERFPSSNRGSIIAVVRRLSNTIEPDRTHVEGIPPSPIVASYQEHAITSSPTESASKTPSTDISRPSEVNKSYFNTVDTTACRDSAISLRSIPESDEASHDDKSEDAATSFVQHPGPGQKSPSAIEVPTSDEDEGIAMNTAYKRGNREDIRGSPTSPTPKSPTSSQVHVPPTKQPTPNKSPPMQESEKNTPGHNDRSSTVAADNAANNTATHAPTRRSDSIPGAHNGGNHDSESRSESEARSTAVDPGSQPTQRKRTADHPTALSPSARSMNGVEQVENNLRTLIQFVFAKWIGGFVSWLCGSRHRV
ncbi:hypothetical protein F4779DRAFT_322844 [Xylariaceae sp. FL0662B]|nr:hypothetical protein F4779DRAFT_322844 [Xylariaceae sp. FL0662B]